ncbi:MAG TPA: diaminopimelate epimerase [bacterium]|nr:diaminopimelate epimerase [bacterium]HOL66065.1 diaminopimelate epimerase [bacterium]HPP11410.1 diaminopimelate epimerase [bacterium]
MEFIKIVGSGNDFVVVDNRTGKIRHASRLAKAVCQRKFGVGADGLVLLEQSRSADFRMRIFNPDGSEAEMCGNGLRCLVRFIKIKKISAKNHFIIETRAGLHQAFITNSRVKISMAVVGRPVLHQALTVGGQDLTVHSINTGVPHAVVVVADVASVDVAALGPMIRFHPAFLPAGTNVDWVQITGRQTLKIRTFERGVEAETLSCGTGTVAAALVCFLLGRVVSPVTVTAASGEKLRVSFTPDLQKVFLEGKTSVPFSGTWLEK